MTTQNRKTGAGRRLVIVIGLVAAAFVASFAYAASKPARPQAAGPGVSSLTSADASASACACCGTGGAGAGEQIEKSAKVAGDVQTIKVDASKGTFDPNRIVAKAGVPIEIEFSQAPGGCLSAVVFPDFGVNEDLTAGPKTVKLPALEAGEYSFSCQMQMIFGTLVVQ